RPRAVRAAFLRGAAPARRLLRCARRGSRRRQAAQSGQERDGRVAGGKEMPNPKSEPTGKASRSAERRARPGPPPTNHAQREELAGPVLITGGAGFIGANLVRHLLELDAPTRVFDDFSTGRWENLSEIEHRIEVHEGDVRDLRALKRVGEGAGAIVHLAAVPP